MKMSPRSEELPTSTISIIESMIDLLYSICTEWKIPVESLVELEPAFIKLDSRLSQIKKVIKENTVTSSLDLDDSQPSATSIVNQRKTGKEKGIVRDDMIDRHAISLLPDQSTRKELEEITDTKKELGTLEQSSGMFRNRNRCSSTINSTHPVRRRSLGLSITPSSTAAQPVEVVSSVIICMIISKCIYVRLT